jgi:hypothetical protein
MNTLDKASIPSALRLKMSLVLKTLRLQLSYLRCRYHVPRTAFLLGLPITNAAAPMGFTQSLEKIFLSKAKAGTMTSVSLGKVALPAQKESRILMFQRENARFVMLGPLNT